MEYGVTVSRRLLERHRDTTYSHCLAALGVSHEHGLFIDWATAGGALAGGTTEEFALHLAVLTDHERGPRRAMPNIRPRVQSCDLRSRVDPP